MTNKSKRDQPVLIIEGAGVLHHFRLLLLLLVIAVILFLNLEQDNDGDDDHIDDGDDDGDDDHVDDGDSDNEENADRGFGLLGNINLPPLCPGFPFDLET